VKITVRVFELIRHQNTPDGNPRWRLITSHGNYITKDNASVNYEISVGSVLNKFVTIELEKGKIVGLEQK
jgi:hypothetical protein